MGELVAAEAGRLGATAVGGLSMGADPVACAALAAGADVKAFFVRKDRCLVVEDVVTTGGSTVQAIEALQAEDREIVGVVSVLDRLAGGGEKIAAAAGGAPYTPLATIDDVYPDRPDR